MGVSGDIQPDAFAEVIRSHVDRIVASDSFARSPNSIKFLRFIVDETLAGRRADLKESVIGTEVFHIKDFDPRVHSSVRKEAQRLRERLEDYYNRAGDDAVRIEVPKGAFKPEFHRSRRRIPRWLIPLAVVVALAALVSLWFVITPPATRVPGDKRITVLPFTRVDSDAGSNEFRLGLLFTLTTRLSQIERFEKSFWVTPAAEVLANGVDSAGKACRALGANLVVTGSIEKNSGKTRLTMNLIRCLGDSQKHLNSKVIDSLLGDVFVLQDQVVQSVIEMLELKLEKEALAAVAGNSTLIPAAGDFYLRARGYLLQGREGIDHAIELFRLALDQEPTYALAHAGLGEAYLQKYDLSREAQWIDMARDSCDRAIRINASLVPVYITKGMIRAAVGDYPGAVQEYRRALEIDPRNSDTYSRLAAAYDHMDKTAEAENTYKLAVENRRDYWGAYKDIGVFYYRRGRYESAKDALLWAKRLAPDNSDVQSDLAGVYIQMGRWIDAESILKESLARQPSAIGYNNLSAIYFYQGRYGDAIPPIQRAVELDPGDVQMVASLARMQRLAGHAAEAHKTAVRAIRLAQQQLGINSHDAELTSVLALLYAENGDRIQAVRELRKAHELAPANMNVLFYNVWANELVGDRAAALQSLAVIVQNGQLMEEVRKRPELAGLRADPSYKQLIERRVQDAPGDQKRNSRR